MRLSDADADRLLGGQLPADHADLESVAAFLSELPNTYPHAELGPERAEHLFAVTREARLLAAAPPLRHRRSTRRAVVTALVAGFGVLTTGVGVAAAVGANPLAFLPNLLPQPAISARIDTPAAIDPSTTEPAGPPVPPKPTSQPSSPVGTETSPGNQSTAGTESSNNGKSDEAKGDHKPTAKPSHTNNGKSDQAKSDDKSNNGKSDQAKSDDKSNNGKSTAKPTPSNNARTDPPGKTKPGDSASGNNKTAR